MNNKKRKIIFIGNSIVNGFPYRRSECFVSLYRDATGEEVINKGINGETSPQAVARLEKDVLAHKPDVMVFLGGTNDYIMGICTPEETMQYYETMGKMATEKGIQTVFLIPLMVEADMAEKYWIPEVDYAKVVASLEDLRERMLLLAKEKEVRVIDTQTYFSQLYTKETREEYLRDGLHPTPEGHRRIAEFLVKEV